MPRFAPCGHFPVGVGVGRGSKYSPASRGRSVVLGLHRIAAGDDSPWQAGCYPWTDTPPQATRRGPIHTASDSQAQMARILLVEDAVDLRNALATALQSEGHVVAAADDGEQGSAMQP